MTSVSIFVSRYFNPPTSPKSAFKEIIMRTTLSILTVLAIMSPVALTGCDRTVSETSHSSTDANGNTKQDTKTVTQDPNGNVTVNKESKTVNANP